MLQSSPFDSSPLGDPDMAPSSSGFRPARSGGVPAWSIADERVFLDHIPSLFLASDLFAAAYLRAGRHCLRPVTPLALSAVVTSEGPWLDQGDLDVYLACLLLALRQGGRAPRLRCPVEEPARQAGLGGRAGATRFAARLHRLHEARIACGDGRFAARMQLVSAVVRDEASGTLRIEFGPEPFEALREAPGVARFIADRAALGRDGLGKWLLGVAWTLRETCLVDPQRLRTLAPRGKGRDILPLLQEFARRGYIRDMVTRSDGLVIVQPGHRPGGPHAAVCGGGNGNMPQLCRLLT
ncbi:MAG: hypothetical protein LBU75_10200 [Desulfovibrio sp.]|jgi:hypothetical protein|nr:hypothetical protein [Desulfovibrio sp.]